MQKIKLVFLREYITRVKNKAFLLITLLSPLGILVFYSLPLLINEFSSPDTVNILVIDDSKQSLLKIADSDEKNIYFQYAQSNKLEDAKENFVEKGFTAILHIPPIKNLSKPKGITLTSEHALSIKTVSFIEKQLQKRIEHIKLTNAGLSKEILAQLKSDVRINTQTIAADNEIAKDASAAIATMFGMGAGIIIYMILLIYGTMVMRGVMEEKTNRIVEVIISSVKPFQLMMGKILGIGAVGLTQFAIWGILLFAINMIFSPILLSNLPDINAVNPQVTSEQTAELGKIMETIQSIQYFDFTPLLISFVFYFLFGYLLYASLFAAVGSIAGEQNDNQSITFIVILPIIISFMIGINVINNPNSNLAIWSSIIPLTSPIVMLVRIPFGVPFWQIALSCLCLILGFIGSTWLAAKIYRTGILMYGKKISLKEVGKWLFFKA